MDIEATLDFILFTAAVACPLLTHPDYYILARVAACGGTALDVDGKMCLVKTVRASFIVRILCSAGLYVPWHAPMYLVSPLSY